MIYILCILYIKPYQTLHNSITPKKDQKYSILHDQTAWITRNTRQDTISGRHWCDQTVMTSTDLVDTVWYIIIINWNFATVSNLLTPIKQPSLRQCEMIFHNFVKNVIRNYRWSAMVCLVIARNQLMVECPSTSKWQYLTSQYQLGKDSYSNRATHIFWNLSTEQNTRVWLWPPGFPLICFETFWV